MQIDNKKKIIISIILIIVLIIFIIYTIINNQYEEINLDDIVYGNSNNEISNTENTEKNLENNDIEDEDGDKEEQIVVHVTGEVKKGGIVYLKKGARVIDAIEKAGGETKEADLSQINLAYELQDGQKIYIPNKNEKISEYITGGIGNNDLVEENSNRKGEKSEY